MEKDQEGEEIGGRKETYHHLLIHFVVEALVFDLGSRRLLSRVSIIGKIEG